MAGQAQQLGWLRGWWTTGVCLAALAFPGLWAQKVLVNETVSGFIGTDVILHCNLVKINHTRITQVTWQKGSNGSKQNVAIYNPVMGVSILPPYEERVVFQSPSITDGTIKLSNLQLDDEGIYICEFATFPTGNRENQLNLTVLAKPVNRMEGTSRPLIARAGMTEKILVATCISSNGKPPSTVTWDTKLKGEAEFQEIRNENGTITVISRYRLLPSREAHQQQLKCVVNYQFERFTQSMTLNVLYEPEVRIDGFDSNWYLNRKDVKLTCISDANPPAMEYQWKLLNGSLPDSAEIQNSTLFFKGPVTYSLSATYICEATNTIGTRSGQVEVNVTEFPYTPSPPGTSVAHPTIPTAVIGGVVGGASLVVVVAVVVLMVLRHRRHTFKGDYSTKKHVYGNGYSKAGIPQHHPPMAQNLQYPDDSDDEKKPGPLGSNSYEDEDDDGAGAERKHRSCPNKYEEDSKRPYFTVDEGEAHSEAYNERTLGFQYDPEQLDIADNMVSQNDGSFISKKEWLRLNFDDNSSLNLVFLPTCTIPDLLLDDKPLPQGGLRGVLGILGAVIAALFIIGGAVTVFIIYRRQKKNRSDTENDLIDLPSSQKTASLPLSQNQEVKSQLTAENIQVVHLDNMKEQEEEVQKTSSQPPYYDMAATESTPNPDKLTAGNDKDSNVQYAELDTSVLTTSSPSHRTSVPVGGDLVEYATIQANVC